MKKIAVILFNLGGPSSPEAVKPFLFNLFNDKYIISLPKPFRFLLAKLISSKREDTAKEIYSFMGGRSPILENTQDQADALLKQLTSDDPENEYQTFICMRYWHPFSQETLKDVQAFAPDEMLLVPLYPQFSTTTVLSSVEDWKKLLDKNKITTPVKTVCCYYDSPNFIHSQVDLIKQSLEKLPENSNYRMLFSAHGLPEKIVKSGDSYQWQVEQTAQKVVDELALDGLDWLVSYQSRVGPLKWIEPNTEDEIIRAGKEGKDIILIPIAFVSEHSETLVELDIEYAEVAEESGVSNYVRVPTVSSHEKFIQALAQVCADMQLMNAGEVSACDRNKRCPHEFKRCPHQLA